MRRTIGLVLAVAAVAVLGWRAGTSRAVPPQVLEIQRLPDAPENEREPVHPAMRYAVAVRDGDCDTVIDMTSWIQERLAYVSNTSGAASAVTDERAALCRELTTRGIEGNQLQAEGIEDRYVFAPGCSITLAGEDGGHDGLDGVARRAWLEVTYPLMSMALRNETARPIRSIVVGVNLSREGKVMKAGVLGNLDIQWGSVDLDWDSVKGDR